MNRTLLRLLLAFVALAALAVASAGFSSSASQGGSRNGNLQIAQLYLVVINGDDIRNLPAGENRIIQKAGGGNSSANVPTGSVVFTIDGVDRSTPLRKIGTGTLALPNSNSYGVTKVGPGTLANTPTGGSSMKEGQGRLILSSTTSVVYEFRNLAPAELARVFLPDATTSISLNFTKIAFATGPGPQDTSKRLLFGPAQAISRLEDWKVGAKPPVSKFVCSGGSCVCNGSADCFSLASSCSSEMSCAGTGSSISCSCKK
jgi:hypothetical protein